MNSRWTVAAFDVASDTQRRRLDRHLGPGFTFLQRSVRVSSPGRAAVAEVVLRTVPAFEAGDRFVVVRSCTSCAGGALRVAGTAVVVGFDDPVVTVVAGGAAP